jgi:hypothetical protein
MSIFVGSAPGNGCINLIPSMLVNVVDSPRNVILYFFKSKFFTASYYLYADSCLLGEKKKAVRNRSKKRTMVKSKGIDGGKRS